MKDHLEKTMTELVLTRGLPGSGKTTWAKEWVEEDLDNRTRVNRDDLRLLLHGKALYLPELEKAVTLASHASVEALLRGGKSVIVDDTNLRIKYVRNFVEIAKKAGAEYRVVDFETDVNECIRRDKLREKYVGEEIILDMAQKFIHKGKLPKLPDFEQIETAGTLYVPKTNKPRAILVDIDGTVALHNRNPYDYDELMSDSPNWPVIHAVNSMQTNDYQIVFMSGRPDSHKDLTVNWLNRYFSNYHGPFMRTAGDDRADYIVKQELFDAHVRNDYNIIGVFDDRAQVVRMWRGIGLTVFHVDFGDF